jgi:hypothetical protein
MLKMVADMASQAIVAVAKLAMSATGILSGGSSSSYIGSAGSEIDAAIGGMSFKSFHGGGLIYAHEGFNLAADEVPIIAQTGERVLSRKQNEAYEAGTTLNLTVQNNTGTPVKATAKQSGDRDFILMLDKMNAALINSGGDFAKSLESKYVVSRAVTRR